MLARLEYKDGYSLAVGFFMTFCVSLHQCSGSSESGGPHTQITSTLQRMPFFQVQDIDYKEHNGLISKVCEKRFTASKDPTLPHSCWRVKEGNILCPGKRRDMQDMVVSIPMILAIEVGDRLATVRFRTLRTMFEPEPNIMFGVRFSKTTEHEPEWRFRFSARANPNILFRTEHFRCSIGPERNKSWCIFCIYSTLYIHSTCYIHYI